MQDLREDNGYDLNNTMVTLVRSLGLEMDRANVEELVTMELEVLLAKDCLDLRNQDEHAVQQHIDADKQEEENVLLSGEIKDVLQMWARVFGFVSENHPQKKPLITP